jgi:hypothetical protein
MTPDLFPDARVDPTVDADRRYTTRQTMDLCMRLAKVDGWNLDVAADEESHWAPNWFDVQTDGLKQGWYGNVWCNPPYSDIGPWVRKAWWELENGLVGTIAMLLPANRTEQPFWQEHVEPFRDDPRRWNLRTHFLPTRVRFGHPGNRDGIGAGSPKFGCVLLVWRRP